MLDLSRIPENYHGLAKRAEGDKKSGLKAAVRLFCIQCYGWNLTDARSCAATACPLYAQNLRVFRRGVPDSEAGSPDLAADAHAQVEPADRAAEGR